MAAEALPEGGVSAHVVRPNDPDVEARLDAAALGWGAAAGTDLAAEMVTQMTAATAYRANLATLRTADELEQSLIAIRA